MSWTADWGTDDIDHLKRKVISTDYMLDLANAEQERANKEFFAPDVYGIPTSKTQNKTTWWTHYLQNIGFNTKYLKADEYENCIPTTLNQSTYARQDFRRLTYTDFKDYLPSDWIGKFNKPIPAQGDLYDFSESSTIKTLLNGRTFKVAKEFYKYATVPSVALAARNVSNISGMVCKNFSTECWAIYEPISGTGKSLLEYGHTGLATQYQHDVPDPGYDFLYNLLDGAMNYSRPYSPGVHYGGAIYNNGYIEECAVEFNIWRDNWIGGTQRWRGSIVLWWGGLDSGELYNLSPLFLGGRISDKSHRYRMWSFLYPAPDETSNFFHIPRVGSGWCLGYETTNNEAHDFNDNQMLTYNQTKQMAYNAVYEQGIPDLVVYDEYGNARGGYTMGLESRLAQSGFNFPVWGDNRAYAYDVPFIDKRHNSFSADTSYRNKVTLVDNIDFQYK